MATLGGKAPKNGRELLNMAGITNEEIRVTLEKATRGKRVQGAIDQLNKGLRKSKGL